MKLNLMLFIAFVCVLSGNAYGSSYWSSAGSSGPAPVYTPSTSSYWSSASSSGYWQNNQADDSDIDTLENQLLGLGF